MFWNSVVLQMFSNVRFLFEEHPIENDYEFMEVLCHSLATGD